MNPTSAKEDHQQSEEQLSLLQTISMEVAAASDLASALEVVLREVCEKTGWVIGQAWVPNSDSTVLDLVVGWYCGDGELKPFKAASEASHFKQGVGLPASRCASEEDFPFGVQRQEDLLRSVRNVRNVGVDDARLRLQ